MRKGSLKDGEPVSGKDDWELCESFYVQLSSGGPRCAKGPVALFKWKEYARDDEGDDCHYEVTDVVTGDKTPLTLKAQCGYGALPKAFCPLTRGSEQFYDFVELF